MWTRKEIIDNRPTRLYVPWKLTDIPVDANNKTPPVNPFEYRNTILSCNNLNYVTVRISFVSVSKTQMFNQTNVLFKN